MPEYSPGLRNIADRANHLHNGTFFRKNGRVILAPDDLAENTGDFLRLDRDGNPLDPDGENFLRFVAPENADGWFPYLGTSPSGVSAPTKQAASPLPIGRPSFMANQPIFPGDPPPSQNDPGAAKLPRPETPILVAETVGIEGYAASTASSPFFLKLSYGKRRGSLIAHTALSPAVVVPPTEHGQSIRAILYEDVPEGVTHIGVWLTEPGTSTASTPGSFYLQREVEVEHHNPGAYDLTGPFRADRKAPAANETVLPSPAKASLRFVSRRNAAKPGSFISRVVWADENGESLPGHASSSVRISVSSYYETFDDEGNSEGSTAGAGHLEISRPSNPPPGATGWRAYVYNEGSWHVVYRSRSQDGNERPLPLNVSRVQAGGWSSPGDNEYASRQTDFLVSRELPTENTSGIEDPTDDLEQPIVFGVVRPPAGTYYGQITETVRGKESIPSRIASVTITANQIPRLVRVDAVDPIPNSENLEIGASGLPLDHTIVAPAGGAFMEGSDFILQTVSGQENATYSSVTRIVSIDPTEDWNVDVLWGVENPLYGTREGSVQTVLEEISATGVVTQTVLSSLSAVGEDNHTRIIYSKDTAVSGGDVKWKTDTVAARLLTRFVGTRLRAKIRRRHLHKGRHKPHRKRRRRQPREFTPPPPPLPPAYPEDSPVEPEPEDPPAVEEPYVLPPGTEVDADVPPTQPTRYEPLPGVSPTLVEWPTPDRPSSSGTLLEAKHDFESALPNGWEQITTGATLTRASTSTLSGTYSLRSYKAS